MEYNENKERKENQQQQQTFVLDIKKGYFAIYGQFTYWTFECLAHIA